MTRPSFIEVLRRFMKRDSALAYVRRHDAAVRRALHKGVLWHDEVPR